MIKVDMTSTNGSHASLVIDAIGVEKILHIVEVSEKTMKSSDTDIMEFKEILRILQYLDNGEITCDSFLRFNEALRRTVGEDSDDESLDCDEDDFF